MTSAELRSAANAACLGPCFFGHRPCSLAIAVLLSPVADPHIPVPTLNIRQAR